MKPVSLYTKCKTCTHRNHPENTDTKYCTRCCECDEGDMYIRYKSLNACQAFKHKHSGAYSQRAIQ